jgi:Flp pilus assembly pilin Flp
MQSEKLQSEKPQPENPTKHAPTKPKPVQRRKKTLKSENGQSLVEYLLLTSLMAVAAMGVMRVMSHSVNAKFAQVTESIQGKDPGSVKFESVVSADYEKRDMSDFMTGSTKAKKSKGKAKVDSIGDSIFGSPEIEF